MIQLKEIERLVAEHLQGTTQYLVEAIIKPGNKILVYIDGDKGVTIDDCVSLSRFIESSFDREEEDFELNVSSPGIDQPLKFRRQYVKNVGRSLNMKLTEGRTLTGKLEEVNEDNIKILPDPVKKNKKVVVESIFIRFDEILETKVIISFK